MIGDKNQDIVAGKKAGIQTACVLYGHGTKIEISESKPDYILENTSELMGIAVQNGYNI